MPAILVDRLEAGRKENRHRVGLLSCGAGRAPGAKGSAMVRETTGLIVGKDFLLEKFEMLNFPEECRKIGGERIDQMSDLPRFMVRLQQVAILLHAGETETVQSIAQPVADHLFLFLPEMDAALVIHQLSDELEIGISNMHDSS